MDLQLPTLDFALSGVIIQLTVVGGFHAGGDLKKRKKKNRNQT